MKCGFESVFFGKRSEKCELEKRVLGEMRGGKEGKEGEKQDEGVLWPPERESPAHRKGHILWCG
jgi:hypothetical protein